MFTAEQLVAHLVGDFVLQNDWMASQKTRNSFAAFVHVVFYTLPFLLITLDPATLLVIAGTHFIIDRWRLARQLTWILNRPWPGSRPWSECRRTGYPPDLPRHMADWLLIIVDGTMHILINGTAIYYLG